MTFQQRFDQLAQEYDLKPADFYLLDLIPLIEMMWIDGKNQAGELKILYQFVIEHIALLDQAAGMEVVSIDEANDFLDRFAHSKPSPHLLNELRQLVTGSETASDQRKLNILEYCLDISAACVSTYPYKNRERIMTLEKQFLLKLMEEFKIPLHVSREVLGSA